MKRRWFCVVLAGAAASSWIWPVTTAGAATSDVFRARTFMQGVIQFGGFSTNSVIHPVQIRDVDLINLGLGRSLETPVPNNQRLALAAPCQSSNLRIIIYDTSTSSNLATIGYMNALSVIEGQRRNGFTRNVISELTYIYSQNVSNGLAGGQFFVSGVITADTNECLKSFRGQMTGALGTTFYFTNNIVTNVVDLTVTNVVTNTYYIVENFTVNVARSSITAGGKKLGVLIEP